MSATTTTVPVVDHTIVVLDRLVLDEARLYLEDIRRRPCGPPRRYI